MFAVKPSTHIKGMVEQRQKQVKGGSGLRKKNAISSKTKYTGLKAHINKLNKQTNDANIYEIKPDDSEGDTADGSNGSDLDTVRARAGTDREVSVAMRGAHDAEKEENGDDDRQKDAGETKKMKEREIGLMILDLSPCIEEKEKAYLSFRHQLSTIVHHTKHSIKEYRQRCQQRIQQHEQSLHRDLNPAMNGGFQRKTRNKKRGTHRAVHFEAEAVYNDIDSINDDFSIDHNRHFGQHQHHNIVPQQCHDQHDSRDQSPFHTGQPLGRKSSADDAYGNHHDDGHPQDKYNDGGNPGEGNYSNNHEFLIPLDEEGNPVQTHGGCRTDTDAWDHDRFPSVEMCSDVNSGDSSSSVLGSRNGHDSGTGTGASGGGDGDGYEGHDGDSSEALADLQTTQHILKSNRKTMDQVGEDLEQQLQTIQR